ncbi:MAG: hypothetical protein ACRDVW_02715 [Acidimicrobiales bacterium]
MARVTLSASSPPLTVVEADEEIAPQALARRSDLHVARRQRRRDALLGLGVLAAALGTTIAVLDMFH